MKVIEKSFIMINSKETVFIYFFNPWGNMRFGNLKLGTRITLGNGLILLLMIFMAIVVRQNLSLLLFTADGARDSQKIIANGWELVGDVVRMESDMRGFLIEGDDRFLEPFHNGKKSFQQRITTIETMVQGNEKTLERLEMINKLVFQWIETVADAQIRKRKEVNAGKKVVENFKKLQSRTVGREIFNKIRDRVKILDKHMIKRKDTDGKEYLDHLFLALVNMETGQRGFLLNGQSESLGPYRQGYKAFQKEMKRLKRKVRKHRDASGELTAVRKLVERWIREAAMPEINARKEMNNIKATMDDLAIMIANGKGKVIMEQIQSEITAFIDEEKKLAAIRDQAANDAALESKFVIDLGTGIAVLLGMLISFLISHSITKQVKEVVKISGELADGNLRERLPLYGNNEISQMSRQFNHFIDNLLHIIQDIAGTAASLLNFSEELATIANQLSHESKSMTDKSSGVMGTTEQVSDSINMMAAAVEEMSVNASSVSSSAEQMSANMSAVAESVEEMSRSIGEIANNAQEGAKVSGQAMTLSQGATETMNSLGDTAKDIGEVTDVIKRIAEQTNLLALNATIEAASAGEAGKGFAVVAHEIKELANQSSQAAEDISKRVEGVQENTEEAIKVIASVSEIIDTINNSVDVISRSVETQTMTADDISVNVAETNIGINSIAASISEVAKGVTDISQSTGNAAKGASEVVSNIHGVNQIANETNEITQDVSRSAEQLLDTAEKLKKHVAKFRFDESC